MPGNSKGSSGVRTKAVSFPLADDMIPKLSLTPEDVARYKRTAHEVVSTTLGMEIQYRYRDLAMLNPQDWKFIKSKERMRVYKRITPSEDLVSMVLGVGFIEGDLENAFYGLHHKTTEEMRMTTSFVNKSHLDSAVLESFELGTEEDPYRYLGLKWRVAETPGGSLIKNRDVCNLECMGIEEDSQGISYGYHLLKSVDVPGFPIFPESVVIRAQMMLCCIYRQISPNVIAFYSKGVFNLCGELADFMAFNTSADMVLSISKTVDCAAAKRMTLMFMQSESERGTPLVLGARETSESILDFRRARSESVALAKASACTLCYRKPSVLSSSCKPCRICLAPVCSKCYVKPYVLARPRNFRIVCCKSCVMKSRELFVDPRDPYPIINGSCFQKQHEASSTTETDYSVSQSDE
ncbi:hypothetical protein Gpo141_00012667 [Globisporangium polare]